MNATEAIENHGDPLLADNASNSGSHHSTNESDVAVAAQITDNGDVCEQEDQEEEFVYPGFEVPDTIVTVSTQPLQPTPARLESLFAVASSGDLDMLKKLFKKSRDSGADPFRLANDATSRTGSTALHVAASRGYIDIVMWLIEDCGAMPDFEDREGETALQRASLNGHLNIVQYLTNRGADVQARDSDGWTALHNACSKGYLDVVRCLCEEGGAASDADGVRAIDARSRDGWTPLMNASSKGHLPVVLYLIKQGADPLVRNKRGETAYDTAAAVFETYICELLQQTEAECWHRSRIPYNPLAVHTTLPVIVYENQKLDTRLKTLAVSGGRPIFSASGLGRRGRRSPYELKFPKPEGTLDAMAVPAWLSEIQLPFCASPFVFPLPGKSEGQLVEGNDRSHDCASDWIADVTHPQVDARDGWQYAQHFTDPNEQWTAKKPPALERLLNEGSVVASSARAPQNWVRRRRWVQIMRRRVDVPPFPFLQPDGCMYHLTPDGSLVADRGCQEDSGLELGAITPSILSPAKDYTPRAKYHVGNQTSDAEVGYPSSSVMSWSTAGEKDDSGQNEDKSEEEFHYPGAPSEDRLSVSSSTDFTSRPGISRAPTDLTPQLSQAPDFRVPTREAPQTGLTPRRISPSPQTILWEKDEIATKCRGCQRRFGLLIRKHHCRKCGRIYCDGCSAFRTLLDPSEIVHDPGYHEASASPDLQRVCKTCHEQVTAGPSIPDKTIVMEPITIDPRQLTTSTSGESGTQLGDLSFCPICNSRLEDFGNAQSQEDHVKNCLSGRAKYLLYYLPPESALIGTECTLCFEKFVKGTSVARPSCLCNFHDSCLSGWLQRGKFCPMHMRTRYGVRKLFHGLDNLDVEILSAT